MIKRLLLLAIVSVFVIHARAITFERKYFKPKGKNFTGSTNHLYYWHTDKTTDKLTMLYYKTSTGVCVFKGFEISKSLQEKLPLIVIKYIGKYITEPKLASSKSLDVAVNATKKAVDIALDQKYKELIKSKGAEMVADSSYFRGHCNTNWWTPNFYYDYAPAFSSDTVKDFLTNPTSSSSYPHLRYISDSLKHFGYHHHTKSLSKWNNVFKKMRGSGSRSLSDWGFNASAVTGDADYHKRSDTCRFTLVNKPIAHGKKYPTFAAVAIFGWVATYCNFFASDLRKAVYGNKIFTTAGCNADMNTVASHNDFVEINKKDMHSMSNAGYLVFLISSSHITTIYPDGEFEEAPEEDNVMYPLKVVQAGSEVGIVALRSVYPNFESKREIKSYIYLGHLKNI
jgi:hypothetical protein